MAASERIAGNPKWALEVLEANIADAPLAEVPMIQGELARISAGLSMRMLSANAPKPVAVEPEDVLLEIDAAAKRLNVTTDWLYKRHGKFPFTRKLPGGQLRFSNNGISAWIRRGKS